MYAVSIPATRGFDDTRCLAEQAEELTIDVHSHEYSSVHGAMTTNRSGHSHC
jgi:hypothetical protein